MKPFYITTPIYYVNDKPHIGHAYTSVACDILARFKRMDGYRVFLLTGTDEHGQKVQQAAHKAGLDPKAFTDKVCKTFVHLAERFEISYDRFFRTTEKDHLAACQTFWSSMEEKDYIYLGSYEGWYATRDETYYAESELVRDAHGNWLAPTGAAVEWLAEPSYFFRLSAFQQRLLDLYERHPDFIGPPNRKQEVISFVEQGLSDLSISRCSYDWGVPVPPSVKRVPVPAPEKGGPLGKERGKNENPKDGHVGGHVMYVWFDALLNYLNASSQNREKTAPAAGGASSGGEADVLVEAPFCPAWPAQLHVVGKDILRFHTVYWPAMLMAAELPLPERVFAHGWWTNEGQKISKSLGNVIDPLALLDRFGLDQCRYFLAREIKFGADGDFSTTRIRTRLNTDLANDLGNLVQRVLTLSFRYYNKKTPKKTVLLPRDLELVEAMRSEIETLRTYMDAQKLQEYLVLVWEKIRAANQYVDTEAPWQLYKTDKERLQTVLWTLCETIRQFGLVLLPFMPGGAGRILDALGQPQEERQLVHLYQEMTDPRPLLQPRPIFPRFTETDPAAPTG